MIPVPVISSKTVTFKSSLIELTNSLGDVQLISAAKGCNYHQQHLLFRIFSKLKQQMKIDLDVEPTTILKRRSFHLLIQINWRL